MATFTGTGSGTTGASSYTLKLDVWENSTDTTNNKSNIGWTLKLSSGSYNFYGYTVPTNVNIGGVTVYNSSPSLSIDANSEITIASGSLDITHNSDGSKTISCSASISNTSAYYMTGNIYCSGELTLTTILRQATITGANNFTDEEDPGFTFEKAGTGTLNVWLEPNPGSDHLCVREGIPNTGSYTWTLTDEEREQLRAKCVDSNSCTCRIGLYTIINGTEYASYVDKTLTIVNANPTFSDFDYYDINTSTINVIGIKTNNDAILIKGQSDLTAVVSYIDNKMVALKGATAKQYIATIDSQSVSADYNEDKDVTIYFDKINSSGTLKLSVRAYDSRNNSTVVTKDITVLDYEVPEINATATRLNNFENETTLSISADISLLTIDDTAKNSIESAQYRYREKNGDWGDLTDLVESSTSTKDDILTTKFEDIVLSLDNSKEFEIEVTIQDKLNTTTQTINVAIGKAIFFISSNKKACYINDIEIPQYDVISTW